MYDRGGCARQGLCTRSLPPIEYPYLFIHPQTFIFISVVFSLQILISIETVKVLRERMSNCYKYEGVNHLENCKEYVEAYSNAIWEIKRKNTPAIGQ